MATDGWMLAAFEVGAEQGCLVVRDTESEGDTSGWNPREQAWLVDRGSVIFAVRPATEGMVRCEVWREAAAVELPHQVFSIDFAIEGALHVGDPSGLAAIELPHVRGERTVRVLVGDPGRDEVIHAAQPWTPDSDAVSLDESDDEKVPSGLAYFLEVELVRDVAEVWSAWRDGRRPTPEQLTEAVIHYAEHDAYLPADAEDSN